MQIGRYEILTDVEEITNENVKAVLHDAMVTHQINADRCDFLLNYEGGYQPLKRIKTYRPEIDIVVNDNIAAEITEFKLGFNWGNPITLTQRGEKDSGKENKEEADAISMLNECYEAEGNAKKTQELARFIEICGIGHTFVDINTDWEDGESYFTITALDPRTSFVVKSSALGHKPMLGVTYRQDKLGNYYFTCFSKDRRYEILNQVKILNGEKLEDTDLWLDRERSGEKNPLGVIPIIEWIRSADRTGVWERQIPEMDNLNILVADFSNDVDQNTQSIWMANDVEFPEDEDGNTITPNSNDWVMTRTTQSGKTPFINPLATTYDYSGMLNNILSRRSLILEKCAVPQRSDNTSGSTGIATSDATGWTSAEASACKEQDIISTCKMEEVKVVLRAIKKSSDVPADSPLLKLRAIDVVPCIKRQKTYELATKINCFATGVSHGLDYKSLIKTINLFDDPQQVITDSEESVKMYLASTFKINEPTSGVVSSNVQDRASSDESDQIGNSPILDGNKKENPEGSKESKEILNDTTKK